MDAATIKEQIIDQLDKLSLDQQRQVLDFAAGLAHLRGIPGSILLERVKHISIEPADLEAMSRAIEEEFEKVDPSGWDLPA